MLIKEFIEKVEIERVSNRLYSLKEYRAPRMIIEAAEQELADILITGVDCGGETHLLNERLETYEVKRDKESNKYYLLNFSSIIYIPNKGYGAYIKRAD